MTTQKDTRSPFGAIGDLELSRRHFIAAAGALVVGVGLDVTAAAQALGATLPPTGIDPNGTALGGYVVVAPDGTITILFGGAEMGQGGSTGLAQAVAEELGAAWADITVQSAPVGGSFPTGPVWLTGGSSSIRSHLKDMRTAGAQAREMLKAAAAQTWGLSDTTNLVAVNSTIKNTVTNQVATFASLATVAATMPVPASPTIGAMPNIYVGAPMPRLDIPAKTNGSALYGIDVTPKVDARLASSTPTLTATGMLYAVVKNAPVWGGTCTKVPTTMPAGVTAIVNLGNAYAVVVNSSTWAAIQATKNISVTWTTPADAASRTSSTILSTAQGLLASGTGAITADGNPAAAVTALGATPTLDQTYQLPYLGHAPMEVPNATVLPIYTGTTLTGLEVWAPTQAAGSGWALTAAAAASGLAETAIKVHTTLLGGGFGRKIETDFITTAVKTAVAVKKPVKVTWPREEDFGHEWYRPFAIARVRATLGAGNTIAAWSYRTVTQSIMKRFGWWNAAWGVADSTAVECATTATGVPYAMGARGVDWVPLNVNIPTGFWRSVGASINTFVIESAIDELATAAGVDGYTFRKNLLTASTDARAPRFAAVLDAAQNLANTTWGATVPTGRARAISLSTCFESIVATVVEISSVTSSTGVVSMKVHRVALALDCGGVIANPNAVEAQLQGGVAFGLSSTLWQQITWTNGKTDQTNFSKYRVLRHGEMPVVSTTIVNPPAGYSGPTGGVGEVAVPGIAPAIVTAWAKLTGTRVRTLPMFPGLTMGG